jgi:hypothetical protein
MSEEKKKSHALLGSLIGAGVGGSSAYLLSKKPIERSMSKALTKDFMRARRRSGSIRAAVLSSAAMLPFRASAASIKRFLVTNGGILSGAVGGALIGHSIKKENKEVIHEKKAMFENIAQEAFQDELNKIANILKD